MSDAGGLPAAGGASVSDGEDGLSTASASSGSTVRARHWIAFVGIAVGVIVADQLSKAWVVASTPFGQPVEVVGGWLRMWYVANNGALFGLFRDQALVFAALSLAVMGLIVWYHGRAMTSNGWLATIALGLLLGGAIGNFIDRVRLGYVVDFVDMGIPGGWRFYTWNVADAAISTSILLLLLMAILPPGRLGTGRG